MFIQNDGSRNDDRVKEKRYVFKHYGVCVCVCSGNVEEYCCSDGSQKSFFMLQPISQIDFDVLHCTLILC